MFYVTERWNSQSCRCGCENALLYRSVLAEGPGRWGWAGRSCGEHEMEAAKPGPSGATLAVHPPLVSGRTKSLTHYKGSSNWALRYINLTNAVRCLTNFNSQLNKQDWIIRPEGREPRSKWSSHDSNQACWSLPFSAARRFKPFTEL